MAMTYFLTETELARTRKKVDDIMKRAARKGYAGSVWVEAVPTTREVTNAGDQSYTIAGFDVTITGQAPHYEGYTFVAAVDTVGDSVVVRAVPGADTSDIVNDALVAGICEHCHTNRRRTHTYLLRREDGTLMQVGKTCMNDFLGRTVFPVLLFEDEFTRTFDTRGQGLTTTYRVVDIARIAFAAADTWGYHSRESENSTFGTVMTILSWSKGADDLNATLAPIYGSEADVQSRIDAIVAQISDEATGFLANLRVVLSSEFVSYRQIAMAVASASITPRARVAGPTYHSQYIGEVGQTVHVRGRVARVGTIAGLYDTSRRVITLHVGSGDVLTMFTSASWAWEVSVDDEVSLTGTVKDHEEYKGTKQTILVRPRLSPRE